MASVADLLAGGGKSWTGENPGDTVEGTVVQAEVQQQTDLDTDEPIFWDAAKTRPKMMVVATLQTDKREDADDDGKRVVYFSGHKFTALQKSGAKDVNPGDYLKVTYTGESDRAPAKKGYNAAKLYAVEYRKGAGPGVSLGEDGPVATAQAPAASTASAPTVGGAAFGDRPANIPEAAWAAMPDAIKAQLSPPPAAEPGVVAKPDYLPDAAWAAMSPAEQKAVAGF